MGDRKVRSEYRGLRKDTERVRTDADHWQIGGETEMKIAVTILVLLLILFDFGLLVACRVLERRLEDDETDGCDQAR